VAVNEQVAAAWRQASIDLGVRVEAPFRRQADDGTVIEGEVYLPDFATHDGGYGLWRENVAAFHAVRAQGAWASLLYDGYLAYDRQRFIETLSDWGWHGAEDRSPAWLGTVSG
jgi:hypothetical protein